MANFKRNRTNTLSARKGFFIVVEGERTERNYFNRLKILSDDRFVKVQTIPGGKKSDPRHLIMKAEQVERTEQQEPGDEIWIVSDVDGRNLSGLFVWESSAKGIQRNVAVSNPQFELWIALHFDRCAGVKTQADCISRIKKYFPKYEKNASADWIDIPKIQNAVRNGKAKDSPPCPSGKLPTEGITTVYRLVEKIMDSQK